MIVFITTAPHWRTVRSLITQDFGVPTPKVRVISYDRLFRSTRLPHATYIFADLERLAPWELTIAARLYRAMCNIGLRCLNDPARVMSRVQLLTTLYEAGLNAVYVARADERPRPPRFPVFVRGENDHRQAGATLYKTQAELDAALEMMVASGTPLRGLLVTEQVSAPYGEGLWAKWGTYRIGDRIVTEHIAVDDTWLVKVGDHAKVTDAVAADEHNSVTTSRFADDLRPGFEAGHIEFGRADHATVNGCTVIYEINTNPTLGRFVPDRRPLRRETQLSARRQIAEALDAIDSPVRSAAWLPAGINGRAWDRWFRRPRRP